MAVAGGIGHWRCPHCGCWLPTRESWLPIIAGGVLLGLVLMAIAG